MTGTPMEWIRFVLTAVFMIVGLCSFICAVLGVFNFGYIMNRLHAAGIGDTMGLMSVLVALMISAGFGMDLFKLIAVAAFMWCTSPVSTHFMGQIEYFTNPDLSSYLKLRRRRGDTEET